MKAMITDIKRFAVHDGDGIRTTVFFKGCPLRCVWCHNPETYTGKKQMAFYEHKCSMCGRCGKICSLHEVTEQRHQMKCTDCTFCGKCVEACPQNALQIYGREVSVEELMPVLLEDKEYYLNSNGGITLSGGECLLQPRFCAELLKRCKEQGLHTAVDTCGYVSKESLDMVIPYTDVFLYDLKALDEEVHIRCTGASNQMILENLKYLDDRGCLVEIRIPYVPEYNDDQIEKLSVFVKALKNVVRVRVLPYHNYAASKYDALRIKNTLPQVRISTKEECSVLEELFTVK